MKRDKIIYWIATSIVAFMMLFSGYMYFTSPDLKGAFEHLGFPDYFRIELAVAKLLGALILILPFVPNGLKDFAYAGFVITFISAFIAHMSSGDPVSAAIMPVVLLLFLAVSYVFYNKVYRLSTT